MNGVDPDGGVVSTINSYKDLDVWQLAMKLAVDCYRATKSFPRDELFGLTSQRLHPALAHCSPVHPFPTGNPMSANLAALLYLASGILFILALRGLSSHRPHAGHVQEERAEEVKS